MSWVLRVLPDRKGKLESVASQALPEPLAHKALPDLPEQPERKAYKAFKVFPV